MIDWSRGLSCSDDCSCHGQQSPEEVIATDILMLTDRLSRDWLPEYDGGEGVPHTRELYERLRKWAERTVNAD